MSDFFHQVLNVLLGALYFILRDSVIKYLLSVQKVRNLILWKILVKIPINNALHEAHGINEITLCRLARSLIKHAERVFEVL